jgi:acyl-CoA synthetase (AMP-forming)/AMP-acid ligase II
MRWSQTQRAAASGIGFESVLLLSTPLYSNTTLVPLLPGLALGATAVLMSKFDTRQYLALASRHRATHTVMVPVQYQRLMDEPTFDAHDLSSLRIKGSTSAPFSAALKAEVLRRWPGELSHKPKSPGALICNSFKLAVAGARRLDRRKNRSIEVSDNGVSEMSGD